MLIFCICQTAHFNGTSSFLWAPTPWSVNSRPHLSSGSVGISLIIQFSFARKWVIKLYQPAILLWKTWRDFLFELLEEAFVIIAQEVWERSLFWVMLARPPFPICEMKGLGVHWSSGCSETLWYKWILRARYMPGPYLLPSRGAAAEETSLFPSKRTVSLKTKYWICENIRGSSEWYSFYDICIYTRHVCVSMYLYIGYSPCAKVEAAEDDMWRSTLKNS